MQATSLFLGGQDDWKRINPYDRDPDHRLYIREPHKCGECGDIHIPGTRCAMQPQTATQVLPQVSDAKTLKVCQHFAKGDCRHGDECTNIHTLEHYRIQKPQTAKHTRPLVAIHSQSQTPVQRLPKSLTKCRYYAKGYCRNGSSCQFLHPLLTQSRATAEHKCP